MAQLEVHNVCVNIPRMGTLAAGSSVYVAMALPGTTVAGGITLTKVNLSSNLAIAVGTAPSINLVTLNSVSAVIATVAALGSVAYAAGSAQAMTISTYWIPGTVSYLGLEVETATYVGNTTTMSAMIQYVMGRGNS